MSLKQRLEADVKQAMRERNEVARDTLRLLLSEFKRIEVQEGRELTAEIEQDVLLKAAKQRQQSIAEFEKAGRPDLVTREQAEQAVIRSYLPQAFDEAQARAALTAIAAELGATTKQDLGAVMKAAMARHKGQLDGKLAQRLLGELLA